MIVLAYLLLFLPGAVLAAWAVVASVTCSPGLMAVFFVLTVAAVLVARRARVRR